MSCPICFEPLNDKIKASPDNCDHKFCLQCLERWAKLGSYCPVDRKRFKKILNLQTDSLIQVKSHKRKRKRTVYDFTSHCEICSSTTDPHVMLLCDCCDLGYHIHCLTPPLKEVPAGLWFCQTCIAVEEKLKKKNGITKEVEAEIGGFDKLLYKNKSREKVINENESPVKAKNADNATHITESTSVLQACHDIINTFEDMDVRKNCCKDECSSTYLDSAINKIDKIYKTFGTASKTSISKHSKNLKTYSVTNTYLKTKRTKSFDVVKSKKSHAESVQLKSAESCLKNNISSDSNLHNHTVTADTYHLFINNSTLYDDNELFSSEENGKEYDSSIHNDKINLYSETDDISDEIFGNSLQRKSYQNFHSGQIFEDSNTSKSENELVIEKNGKGTAARKSFENCMNESAEISSKKKKHNKYVTASKSEDSIPSSSRVRNKPSKEKYNIEADINFNSAEFQPKVVLFQIDVSSKDIFHKSFSFSNSIASTHEFFENAPLEVTNPSKFPSVSTSFIMDDNFDNQSVNSDFSDQTEIYSTDTFTALQNSTSEFHALSANDESILSNGNSIDDSRPTSEYVDLHDNNVLSHDIDSDDEDLMDDFELTDDSNDDEFLPDYMLASDDDSLSLTSAIITVNHDGTVTAPISNKSSISSMPILENEQQSQCSNECMNFDYVAENINATHQAKIISQDDDFSDSDIEIIYTNELTTKLKFVQSNSYQPSSAASSVFNTNEKPNNNNESEFKNQSVSNDLSVDLNNHIAQPNNKSSISSMPTMQNEQSQNSSRSMSSDCVLENVNGTHQPKINSQDDNFSQSDIQIIHTNELTTNFNSVFKIQQSKSNQISSTSSSVQSTNETLNTSNKNQKLIQIDNAVYAVERKDGLYACFD